MPMKPEISSALGTCLPCLLAISALLSASIMVMATAAFKNYYFLNSGVNIYKL